MKLFSECNDCIVCSNSGHCIAGHSDNHFSIKSKGEMIYMLNNEELSNRDINIIKGCLLIYYDFNYDIEKEKIKKISTNKKGAAFSYLFDNK